MLNEYLEFARGEGGEQSTLEDLSDLARDAAAASAVPWYGVGGIALEAAGRSRCKEAQGAAALRHQPDRQRPEFGKQIRSR